MPTTMPSAPSVPATAVSVSAPSTLTTAASVSAFSAPVTALSAFGTPTTASSESMSASVSMSTTPMLPKAPTVSTPIALTTTASTPFSVPVLGSLAAEVAAASTPAVVSNLSISDLASMAPTAAALSSSVDFGTQAGSLSKSDGPPPKKKACLTIAGTPPSIKNRQNGAAQKVSTSSMAHQQIARPGTLNAMFANVNKAALTPMNEPCLPRPEIVELTCSQRLFSMVTQVDRRALTFPNAKKGESSQQFFIFMKLRATHKWATFSMTPYDWVCAASTFNMAINACNREQDSTLSLKTPRALLDKLSEVETHIFSRIRDNNYRANSGRTQFWEFHCKAVYLGSKIQRMLDDSNFKMGKNHVCGRCKRIMYPEGKNHQDNHCCNVCSNGVRQSSEKVHLVINGVLHDFVEHPPVFPQPKEVFTGGNVFHPARFMEVVSRFYDHIVINHSGPGALAMHDYAFAVLLRDQTVIVPRLDGRPSKVIFKLFHSFKLAPGEAVVLDEHEGEMYLCMDCLSEPPLEVLQDAAMDGLGSAGSA